MLLTAVTCLSQAHALLIVPTFDSNLTSQSNASALEAAIETAISAIDGLYSNPGTVQVLFEFNSGVLGQSQDGESFVTYSQYTAQLTSNSAANPENTVLATAVANLSKGNQAAYVLGTTALLRVGMGFTGPATTPCYDSAGNYVTGCNQIFDGIISIGSVNTTSPGAGLNSQATSVVEHELDEVLGGGGTGTTIGENLAPYLCPANNQSCGVTAIGPTDPYRYQSTGPTCANVDSTPSYQTSNAANPQSNSPVACYSIDGGQIALVQMNEAGGGSDYGDFANASAPYIQDAFYPGTSADYTTLSPEYTMMLSIDYEPLPEPATLALFSGAVAGLGWMRRRRARR